MKKIGFYGGCFNPTTKAHINLAKKAIRKMKLSKLYFVPVGNEYVKEDLIEASKRVEMLQLSINSHNKMKILDIELNQKKNYKANEIFEIIQNKYKDTENYFIMGADNFVNIKNWSNSSDLIQNYKYIIFERKGFNLKSYIKKSENLKKYNKNFNIIKKEKRNISSSLVRNLVQKGKYDDLKRYLNSQVIQYIVENKLYLNKYVKI